MKTSIIRKVVREKLGGVLLSGKHNPNHKACALEARAVALELPWTDNPSYVNFPDLRQINDGNWSSDKARTKALLPVLEALWDWPEWSKQRRVKWARAVAFQTITQIVPIALDTVGLNEMAVKCRRAKSLRGAAAAAYAAVGAAVGGGGSAYGSAYGAAYAAAACGGAAAYAAGAAVGGGGSAYGAAYAAAYAAAAGGGGAAAYGAGACGGAAAYAAAGGGAAAYAAGAAVGGGSQKVLRLACKIWIEASKI